MIPPRSPMASNEAGMSSLKILDTSEGTPRPKMAIKDILKRKIPTIGSNESPQRNTSLKQTALPFVLKSAAAAKSSPHSTLSRYGKEVDEISSQLQKPALLKNGANQEENSVGRELRKRKPAQVQKSEETDSDYDDVFEDNIGRDRQQGDHSASEEEDDESITYNKRQNKKRATIMDSDIDDDDDEYVDEQVKKERRQDTVIAAPEKVSMLRSIFPHLSIKVIEDALRTHGESVVRACQALAAHITENHRRNPAQLLAGSNEGYSKREAPRSLSTSVAASPAPPVIQTNRPRKRLRQKRQMGSSDSEDDTTQEVNQAAKRVEEVRKFNQVLRFYNTASIQEIQDVTGCTEKIAQRMIDQRPILNANDFDEKIKSTAGLSKRFITSYVEVLDGYMAVDRIIEEIERLGGDLSSILDVWKNMQIPDDTNDAKITSVDTNSELYKDAMNGYLHIQPSTIKTINLKNYQLLGINWLLMLYRKNISCILADEMGLGKTAQVIGFLARLKEIGDNGLHLIVVPASTLTNWMREIERFCPELKVLCYYDKAEVRRELQDLILHNPDHGYNIVLTSYTIATQSKEDRSALKKMKFKSLILDEGHMIKNCTSARYSSLMSYKIPFRLLVTGTPLQNNLQELVSLLIFIMPEMFAEFEDEVRTIFKIKSMTTAEDTEKEKDESNQSRTKQSSVQILSQKRIARAKKMMTPFVLRRKKEDVLKDLPKKTRVVEKCKMTERQKEVYDTILQKTTKAYTNAMEAKMEAKLAKGDTKGFKGIKAEAEELKEASKYFTKDELMEIDEKSDAEDIDENSKTIKTEKSEVRGIDEDARPIKIEKSEEEYIYGNAKPIKTEKAVKAVKLVNGKFVTEGNSDDQNEPSAQGSVDSDQDSEFEENNGSDQDSDDYIPSSRPTVAGEKRQKRSTRSTVSAANKSRKTSEVSKKKIKSEESKHLLLSEIKHESDDEAPAAGENDENFSNISNMIIHLRKAADHPLLFRYIYNDKKIRKMAKAIMREERYWDADEDYIYEDMSYMNDFELSKLCEAHRTISSFKLKDEEWMDSGKVEKLKVLLPEMKAKKQKVLIFSQFTRMLDILELVMNTLEIRYLRMDGSTKVTERQTTIDSFNENPEFDVFLLSTKAGGFGINLTGANVVILYDHDFNPQTDRQAEDRAHRVGQTKDVTVYKLMSENTIEEYILEMAELKLRLDDTISSKAPREEDSIASNMQSLLKRTLMASTN